MVRGGAFKFKNCFADFTAFMKLGCRFLVCWRISGMLEMLPLQLPFVQLKRCLAWPCAAG